MPRLNFHTHLSMPVQVIHGKKQRPRLFVSAAELGIPMLLYAAGEGLRFD